MYGALKIVISRLDHDVFNAKFGFALDGRKSCPAYALL